MHDAIVIGVHDAASPTVRLLVDKGYQVVFLEQSILPVHIQTTSLLTATGNGQIRFWDLSEQSRERGQQFIEGTFFDLGSFSLIGFPHEMNDGFAGIYAPQRIVKSKSLMDEAVAAGAMLPEESILDTALLDVATEEQNSGLSIWHVAREQVLRLCTRVVGINTYDMQVSDEVQSMSALVLPPVGHEPHYRTRDLEPHGHQAFWSKIAREELALYTRAQLRAALTGGFPEGSTAFYQGNTKASQHLGKIFFAVMQSYHATLQEHRLEGLLARLKAMDMDVRGYAFEAVAQGLLQLDCLLPGKNRFQKFISGPAAPFLYPMYIGAGIALARLGRKPEEVLVRLDPVFRWLVLEGYGWRYGVFERQSWIENQKVPEQLSSWYGRRVFDQGLGRSLWFTTGADSTRIIESVKAFGVERQADLWSGVGFACGYTGGMSRSNIVALRQAAGAFGAYLAAGTANAASARHRAGHPGPHTDTACEVLCNLTRDEVIQIADGLLEALPVDAQEPAYEIWRQQLTARFAI